MYWLLALILVVVLLFFWSKKTYNGVKFIDCWSSLLVLAYRPAHIHTHYNFANSNKVTGFYGVWVGPKRAYVVNDPDAAHFYLTQKDDLISKGGVFIDNSAGKDLWAHNLVFVNGDVWKRQRKVYNPMFNKDAYESYYKCFIEIINKCASIIDKNKNNDIDAAPLVSHMALDLLGKSILNYNFSTLDNEEDIYYKAYTKFIAISLYRIFAVSFPSIGRKLPQYKADVENVDTLKRLFTQVIEERQKSGEYKGDMVDRLLEASKPTEDGTFMSQKEVISNLFILFLAGHDTTSTALSWLVYELAKNPQIQEKLYNEIITTVGKEKEPTIEELETMNYMGNVINEGMRIHPPINSLASRKATQDLHYKDQVIPAGSGMAMNIYNINNHPLYWENPGVFDPDRWEKPLTHKFAFIPFSLGPRMCIGSKFSLIEQRLFLTTILRKFKVEVPKNHELSATRGPSTFNTPKSMWVRFTERKN